MNNNSKKIEKLRRVFKKNRDKMVRIMATVALDHFNDSFQNQGFTDKSLKKWKPRKPITRQTAQTGNILVDSANLQNSLTITKQQWPRAEVKAVGIPYAGIHNEGGTVRIPITPAMRGKFWRLYRDTGMPQYKWMATTKKSEFVVEIPQRQFMGDSEVMKQKMTETIREELNQKIRRET